MKLHDWLRLNRTPRSAFARLAGLSPASVTALCNDDTAWITRETAERIAEATAGQVTPNDFLGLTATTEPAMSIHKIQTAIDAFARGEILVVTDDDDRENEGDLIIAASYCTPEKMAFIVRNTCGIVCTPLSPTRQSDCASTRWCRRTTRRSARPSRFRSTCAMASRQASRPSSARTPSARSAMAIWAPPISSGLGTSSR